MKRNDLLWGSLLAGGVLSLAQTFLTTNSSVIGDKLPSSYKTIDDYVEQQQRRFNIPGISLAIIEGNQIVHFRGFGRAHPGGGAPTLQTPFFIGSVTKSFTALAIMQLVEQGKLDLDAPVQRYLPWFCVADAEASASITLRHLLNHTSGLSMVQGQLVLSNLDSARNATERQIKALASSKLSNPVGSKFNYNNTNYNILGLVIESASGGSYSDYIQNHIFDPLGMHNSFTSREDAQQHQLAMGHRYWFGIPRPEPNLSIPLGSLPSGQLISSAEDMAHYLIAQLNGGCYQETQILSPDGMEMMHRGAVDMLVFGKSYGSYGMGWECHTKDQTTIISHSGIVPDFGAFAAIIPQQRKGIILLYNANHAMMKMTFDEFGMGAAERLAGVVPSRTTVSGAPWLMRSLALVPILQVIGFIFSCSQLILHKSNNRIYSQNGKNYGKVSWLFELPNLIAAMMLIPMFTKMRGWIDLFMPDFSLIARFYGGFAVAWTFLRVVIIKATMRKYQ